MIEQSRGVEGLYKSVSIAIRDAAPSQSRVLRERSGVPIDGNLANLLVWNVLIAGFLHLGCHLLGDKICNALQLRHSQLSKGDKSAVGPARDLCSQVIEHPLLKKPQVDKEDRGQAVAAIKKILVEHGRLEESASEQAERTIQLLLGQFPTNNANATG